MSRRTSAAVPGRKPSAIGDEDPMEKELSEDAVWKRIQKNTFTRWANEHVKTLNKYIMNLETDLADGLVLIALVEVLSGKKLPRHTKKPNLKPQKLENITIALNFLQVQEKIKIVNIDAADVLDGNLKLILGLIWTLILHYSISMPMWEGEDEGDYGQKGGTPKQRLLNWIKNKIPEVPVNNFTTDWNNGKALGALVDAVAPGLCPEWPLWKPEEALANTTAAMKLADDWLGVPQLIKPEDATNPKVDDLSMMTYLSQYPNAKLKDGAPVKGAAKCNPARVRVYGPGVQPTGVVVGAPTHFSIETFSAGQGNVEILLMNSQGKVEPVEVKFNDDRSRTYTCTYTAKMEGVHKIVVKFAGVEVPKSPFEVAVEGHAGDATKVTATGPGLLATGVQVGKPTYFEITTKNAGKGQVEVIILDPTGKPTTVPLRIRKLEEDKYICEYVAQTMGVHSVNVFFAGKQIPNSPFGVRVAPICDPLKVRASGRGLQPTGVRVGDIGDFKVFTEGAGEGALDIQVLGPDGKPLPVVIKKTAEHQFAVEYKATVVGNHTVLINYGGQETFKSPYEVTVGPFKESKIRAYGPGLVGGVANYPAVFTVDTCGEASSLGFTIEGPSQARIECKDNGDGSANVTYYPSAPGEYAIHILSNGEDIPKSPYVAQVLPRTDYQPDRVTAFGPGLSPTGVESGKPTEFTVDPRKAGGHAPIDVSIIDKDFKQVEVKGVQNKDGTVKFAYTPQRGNKHIVQVNYGGVAVPGSPFRVQVASPVDTTKVKVFGPGVEPGVAAGEPTFINIDCEEAGQAKLGVAIKDASGRDIGGITVMDNGDSTFSVDYTPPPGNFSVHLTYGGLPIKGYPLLMTSKSGAPTTAQQPSAPGAGASPAAPPKTTQAAGPPGKSPVAKSPAAKAQPVATVPPPPVVTQQTSKQQSQSVQQTEQGLVTQQSAKQVQEKQSVQQTQQGQVHQQSKQVQQVQQQTRRSSKESSSFTKQESSVSEQQVSQQQQQQFSQQQQQFSQSSTSSSTSSIQKSFQQQSVQQQAAEAVTEDLKSRTIVKQESASYKEEQTNKFRQVQLQKLPVLKSNLTANQVSAVVKTPSGALDQAAINENPDGSVGVRYDPKEEGDHELHVKINNEHIQGSPFKIHVDSLGTKKVTAYGPGLTHGVAGEPCNFTINTNNVAGGGLQVAVDGPSKAEITCIDNKDGTVSVSYLPEQPGEYQIVVRFAGAEINGSPFGAQVTGEARKKSHAASLPTLAPVLLKLAEKDIKNLSSTIVTPAGVEEPAVVKKLPNGSLGVSFTPRQSGQHFVNVKRGNKHITGSPFIINVLEREIADATKVKMFGAGLKEGKTQILNEFTIDTKEAGYGGLSLSIEGPSKADIECKETEDGQLKMTYRVTEPGFYVVMVKFSENHVPGSPFTVKVTYDESAKATAVKTTSSDAKKATASGAGLSQGFLGRENSFVVDCGAAGHNSLFAAMSGPKGPADLKVKHIGGFKFQVSYTLAERGQYTLNVKYGDDHIPGSPFTVIAT